ncbi:small ribosomal subunit protein uS4m [Diutina catenulata]
MPRKTQNINSLARGRIRASMNKYNLFNLYKKGRISYTGQTLYQQKWMAKQETRSYHGEHLTESRWKTLFTPSLETVAQMDATLRGKEVAETPMPLQTYATLEKRLEFAVFRALFASSVRQARQFILGGHVAVNGVTIKHPSFPLHPGDVFNVSPEKVLLAMGRTKPSLEHAMKVDSRQIAVWNKHVAQAKAAPKDTWDLVNAKPKSLDSMAARDQQKEQQSLEAAQEQRVADMKHQQDATTRESVLVGIVEVAKGRAPEDLTPAMFSRYGEDAPKALLVYTKLSNAKHPLASSAATEAAEDFVNKKKPEFASDSERRLATEVKQLLSEIRKSQQEALRAGVVAEHSQGIESLPYSPDYSKKMRFHPRLDKEAVEADESSAHVDLPWQKGLFGRQDPSKKYFTPWTPRPFIGCFAILPSHIEINFATAHAIYMRDPIARPGHSEVISPYPEDLHQRAYMYYVRKGL